MDAAKKADELVEKFRYEIATSDFHVPEFITGIKCADGSPEYTKVLEDETNSLATQCAIICVVNEIEALNRFAFYWDIRNGEWYQDERKKT